jgi:hypothetical protein
MIISIAHLLAAVLSSWRITELVIMDKITEPIRAKFPGYFLTCLRCVSIWAGLLTVGLFYLYPWANWPFALSWLYIQHIDWTVERRKRQEGRRFIVSVNPQHQMSFVKSELTPDELKFLSTQLKQQLPEE